MEDYFKRSFLVLKDKSIGRMAELVYRTALEMQRTREGTVGSNPTPSTKDLN